MIGRLLVKVLGISILALCEGISFAQTPGKYDAIYSGVPWYDDRGEIVSAHGANIIKDQGRYYLFGEAHTDSSNAFAGFNCYSSADLYNWKFESVALPVQPEGKLGPGRVGERPKVMRCPQTGEYIMYMHVDTLGYTDQFVGYATSASITGPYSFKGPLLFEGKPIRRWDMGAFQDRDGSGYVLIHGGAIYKLNEDYKSIRERTNENIASGFESPAMFRKGDTYYFIGSHLTSWERNDNDYYTSNSLNGPWTKRGFIAPEGTLTWNSQSSFVLPVEGSRDTTYMFMGDRWSFPKQRSAATYVWQPLTVSGSSVSIPRYDQAWKVDRLTGVNMPSDFSGWKTVENTDHKDIRYKGEWEHSGAHDSLSLSSSDIKDASFSVDFKGRQIGVYCLAQQKNGYAEVVLSDKRGKKLIHTVVDMYAKKSVCELRFLSPLLPKGEYTLTVSVLAERPNWSDKRKNVYGSTGYFIAFDRLIIRE